MENNWYDYFIEALFKKYPKKNQLTQGLMDILFIEREAVYRRLRKEVFFSFQEIVKISIEWNLSLDEIIGSSAGQITFQMRQMNYLDPSNAESKFLRQVIQSIDFLSDYPNAEYMCVCNKLPRQVLAGYTYLNQYYLFKWMYQYGHEREVVPYSQVVISQGKELLTKDYYRAIKKVPITNHIWDRFLFDFLVSDIQYFYSIRMITSDEKELIKNDLFTLLDYMQEVTTNGFYPETKNKVNFYISQLNIDTNYSYIFKPDTNVCFVHVFEKFDIHTYNSEMVSRFMTWMQMKKRSSIQISEVDERNRIEYFSRQRQLVNNL